MPFLLSSLKTNELKEPLGIDTPRPEFEWRVTTNSDEESGVSRKFTVQVSFNDSFDSAARCWESSELTAAKSLFRIRYSGPPLSSRQRYFWRVCVCNEVYGTNFSDSTWFETGILDPKGWIAHWISPVGSGGPSDDKPIYLRSEFNIPDTPVHGRAYATACGWYKFLINGTNITGTSLVPRWTPFDSYIEYQTYDITPYVRVGINNLSIVVADGRFKGHLGIEGRGCYGDRLAALVQVEVGLSNGTTISHITDQSWQAYDGKLVHSDPKHGQSVDDRISHDAWLGLPPKEATQLATGNPVEIVFFPSKYLVREEVERVQEVFRLRCHTITQSPNGHQIIDFGQNLTGIVRIHLQGAPGSQITLSYSEIVGRNGEIDLTYVAPGPMPDQPQQDNMILSDEELDYQPWFGIYGFRYVGVEGMEKMLQPSDVEAIIIGTDFVGSTSGVLSKDVSTPLQCVAALSQSSFSCSDERLETLYRNVFWSTLGNLTDTATDCPTRERMGWTGDIQVFFPTATKYFNVRSFFRRYMRNLAAEQLPDGNIPPFIPSAASKHRGGMSLFGRVTCESTGWGDASVIIPWSMYWYYSDETILESQYESMKSWVDSLAKRAREGTSWRRWLFGGIGELEKYILDTGFQWGEWLRASDSFIYTLGQVLWNNPAISTAYLAHSADLLSRTSKVLGKEEDEVYYQNIFQKVSQAWRQAFVRQDGERIGQDCQDDYVRGLAFDLLEPHQRMGAVKRLAELVEKAGFHLATGFMSTSLLLPALANNGRPDIAYKILMQDGVPSWLYQIKKGATTTWEDWAGFDKKGNAFMSHNHYAFGTVAQWLQEGVAGIYPIAPGWRQIRISPFIGGGLLHAAASVDTPLGIVRSSWKIEPETGNVNLEVEIPPFAIAEVVLGNRDVKTIESGMHSFTYKLDDE